MATETMTPEVGKYKEVGYHVLNMYKGCHMSKSFYERPKLIRYLNEQKKAGHNIAEVYYSFYECKEIDYVNDIEYVGGKILNIIIEPPIEIDGTVYPRKYIYKNKRGC